MRTKSLMGDMGTRLQCRHEFLNWKQHRGLHTKAFMRDMGTRLECVMFGHYHFECMTTLFVAILNVANEKRACHEA